jgi:hypothetical protein
MKSTIKMGLLAVTAAAALLVPGQVLAQQGGAGGGGQRGQGQGQGQRGNFDPEQMRQRAEERMRESFGVTDDAEWKILYARIQAVNEARRDAVGGMGGMRGMMRPPGGGPGGDNQQANRARFGGGEPNPAEEALASAIERKATKEELKAAMGKYRDARKASEDKLAKAQEELKALLTVPQEAAALRMGLVR